MALWGNGNGAPTLAVDLWGHQNRGVLQNASTLVGKSSQPRRHRDMREMFVAAYNAFAGVCRAVDEPGVAIVAVHEASGRPQGVVTLRARVDRYVAAIVGRHDSADLYLDRAPELALRHLAVILDPVQSWKPGDASVKYRVLDLRTQDGFSDEHGKQMRGVCAEGPALLRCGGHALFMLPLGDPSDWPQAADDAWAFLPERVYFDELERSPHASRTHMPQIAALEDSHARAVTRRSMIVRTQGPRDTGVGLVEPGDLAGTLDLISPKQRGTIRIGQDALRDGVLLGRYARCDAAKLADDPSMSRVHALLIQIDDAMLVIDTASLNGTREQDKPHSRVIALDASTDLVLGTATRARWRWVS